MSFGGLLIGVGDVWFEVVRYQEPVKKPSTLFLLKISILFLLEIVLVRI